MGRCCLSLWLLFKAIWTGEFILWLINSKPLKFKGFQFKDFCLARDILVTFFTSINTFTNCFNSQPPQFSQQPFLKVHKIRFTLLYTQYYTAGMVKVRSLAHPSCTSWHFTSWLCLHALQPDRDPWILVIPLLVSRVCLYKVIQSSTLPLGPVYHISL
jgi:hypothetical protein